MSDRERAREVVEKIAATSLYTEMYVIVADALAQARAEGAKEGRQAATLSPPAHHRNGKRAGVKFAVEWLHNRAKEMVDPNAKAILNTAAFQLGNTARHGAARLRALAEGGQ